MKLIAVHALLQAVLLFGILALSSRPALGGSVPVCDAYSQTGCVTGLGETCDDWRGAESCRELTGAPPNCTVIKTGCDATECGSGQVAVNCVFTEEEPE